MAGSSFGKCFKLTTWGESHGKGIGAVIDGCPSGLFLDEDDLKLMLKRRRPGQSSITTPRNEADLPIILSGIFEGQTTGTPISIMVANTNQKSKDYSNIADIYRPSHADFGYHQKYGHRDYRGGGRSSGRETIGRVIGGAVAKKLLNEFDIKCIAYTKSVGNLSLSDEEVNLGEIDTNPVYLPNKLKSLKAIELIENASQNSDSLGGSVECIVKNLPVGLGEPVFRKLDALLGAALFSIGGVKAVEVGIGTRAASMYGSQYNDPFIYTDKVHLATNHSGGILGGMSSGDEVKVLVHFKPTPSISQEQKTVDIHGNQRTIIIEGRHDPVIFPRAVVVVESMVSLVLADLLLENASSKIDNLKNIYKK